MKYIFYTLLLLCLCCVAKANTTQTQQLPAPPQVLVLSDIHLDPFVACHPKQTPCPFIQHLMDAPVGQWPALFKQYDHSENNYWKNTNYALFASTLKQISQHHPRFILLLGDYLAHHYQAQFKEYSGTHDHKAYQKFVYKTLQFISQSIAQRFPHTPIYPAVGNNDGYRGDYNQSWRDPFFADLNSLWSPLLKTASVSIQKSLAHGGYYAISPQFEPKLLIVVLNSVAFSRRAHEFHPKQMATLAQHELHWLQQTLRTARRQGQAVWIAFHIPNTMDIDAALAYDPIQPKPFWLPKYNQQFLKLLARYHKTVKILLSGHMHRDAFFYFHIKQYSYALLTTPSISPIIYNNPGYKLFDYNPKTNKITDYQTYVDEDLHHQSHWNLEYQFSKIYSPKCADCSIKQRLAQVKNTPHSSEIYLKHYALLPQLQPYLEQFWLPFYWCAIHYVQVKQFKQCEKLAEDMKLAKNRI